jgi:nitrate/nitrite transporter NarK
MSKRQKRNPQLNHNVTASEKNAMLLKSVRLITIVMVALCLVPAGAHFFELANKVSLSPAEYMTVQKIYAGWSFFGIPIITALMLTLIHTFMVRNNRTVFKLSLSAALCLAATQVIFWMFTYPINVASNNWTVTPEAFEAARRQWEYSHAVNAPLTFGAFVAITLSVLNHKSEVP